QAPPKQDGLARLSLGKKLFFGFSILLLPLLGLGLFTFHSLKSIQDATTYLRSENLPAIEVSKRLGKAAADLLNAANRLSLTLDPADRDATLLAIDGAEKELSAIQADPALSSTPATSRLLPSFEAAFRSFAGTAAVPEPGAPADASSGPAERQGGDFTAFNSGIAAMRDARETLDDTQQNFITLLGKIASAQRQKLAKGQDNPAKIAARLELIDAILDKTAHIAGETNKNVARQDADAIEATAKEFDDVLPMIDQLLAMTPPDRDWKPAAGGVGLARKDDLSNAQSQAQVFRSFLRNFVISWKGMSKAKEKCAADLASLRTISDGLTAAASRGVDERSGATLRRIGSARLFALAAIGGALVLAIVMGQFVTRVLSNSVKSVILQIANTLSSKTKETAERAQRARAMSRETRAAAESGEAAMRTMNEAAEAVRASGEHLRTAMGELREFSQGISEAFKQIDAIALQTRILSLNASVEAARAGRHGAGFAVVADAVRNLSNRSTEASRSSGLQVERALQKVEEGFRTSEEALQRIEAILQSAGRVDGHLREIVEHARNTDRVMEAIATDSAQQSQGLQVISEASREIGTITENNAEAARQTAAAATDLREQAASVQRNVSELVGMVADKSKDHPALLDAGQLPGQFPAPAPAPAAPAPAKVAVHPRPHAHAQPQHGPRPPHPLAKANGKTITRHTKPDLLSAN
ncbi:MAG TPA: methyl-accepting chemotaxis protein, partial [Candidatus Methylacidiphilales bacterium]